MKLQFDPNQNYRTDAANFKIPGSCRMTLTEKYERKSW